MISQRGDSMKLILTFLASLLLASQFGARAADELVVYPPVPGLAASSPGITGHRSPGPRGSPGTQVYT